MPSADLAYMKHTMHTVGYTLRRILSHPGLCIAAVFLIIHLLLIGQYGFTWDFHFHFFGGGNLLGLSPQQLEPRQLPYVEPDPRRANNLPYGPVMSIPPVASFLLLHITLKLLPADSAYHLPIVLWGIAGIAVLYLFLKEAVDKRTAVIGALFLALTPRFFGDMHNNMKDIPSAVAFALNVWLLWRLVRRKRPVDLFLAAGAFALAFNVKINAVYIPIVFTSWLLLQKNPKTVLQKQNRLFLWYFPLSAVAAAVLWSVFWQHPVTQFLQLFSTFGIGTNNIEVILNNQWFCSGSTVPRYYPYWYLGITTPVPLLVFFCIGALLALRKRDSGSVLLLFLLWFFIPLTRYLIPHIGVIDGIRHFEEAVFPVAALAAVGFTRALIALRKTGKQLAAALLIGTFAWLGWNIASYHPYEITYFNELVGGVRGAFGNYDLDYWGSSQKAAVAWVNEHAPLNARIHIVMAAAVAGQYLRPDLLPGLNKYGYDDSDFVIFLNRQSFFYRFYYAYEYLLAHKPAYTVSVRGVPLTWVFDNRTENKTPRQTPWWRGEDPCIIPYWDQP